MTTFVTNAQNENGDISGLSIEKRLEEISHKLSHVLTKDDSAFIKEIIKETVEQLGRWQPWHAGHRALFDRLIQKTDRNASVGSRSRNYSTS